MIQGYTFKDQNLLLRALTHVSFANESHPTETTHNEKLEFLGDAVLDLALSQILMNCYPLDNEGALSKKRASLVNTQVLSDLAVELGLNALVKLGKGETSSGGAHKPRILASTYEAVIGAVFLDSSFEVVRQLIEKHFAEKVAGLAKEVDFSADFKTRLQEWMQSKHKISPVYEVIKEEGLSHEKVFEVSVKLADTVMGKGVGRSKKQAEQDAARNAFESITKENKQ